MTKYVYLNKNRRSNLQLGISTKVFKYLALKALGKVEGVVTNDDLSIVISLKNNNVVFKISTKLEAGFNKTEKTKEIEENLSNIMNFICDSMPYETSIKLAEKKE